MCKDNTSSAASYSGLADCGTPAKAMSAELIADVITANRILFKHNVVDAFGHVSIRHAHDSDRYVLARNMAPALVTADDLVEFDLDSNPVNAGGRPVYLERFLHGEVYRARPDVMAIVHSHAPAVVPFGIVPSVGLRPVWHMSAFLSQPVPIFEIRDTSGDSSDLLIRSPELGASLANNLAQHNVILMRGHGATVVGNNLRQVVFRAVYTQLNAELQLKAESLGAVNYLTKGEAKSAAESVGSQDKRAWDLWAKQVSD